MFLILSGCDSGPQKIRMGEQECDHCRMMISQEQFAAQLITEQGRQYAFDAIECLAAYQDSRSAQELEIDGIWVPDFDSPGNWLPAEEAVYLQSNQLRSPMALNFSAYADNESAMKKQSEFGGKILNWNEVKSIVRREWTGHHYD